MQIGASHPAVKQVQAILRGATTAEDGTELTVAEGLWPAQVAVETGVAVRLLLWAPEALRGPEAEDVVRVLVERASEAYEVSARTLARVSERDKQDGMIAIVELPTWSPDSLTVRERSLVLVSDGIEQPGNLGTLVRTLDACGADALLLTNTRTRRGNVKVFRASHGCTLRVPSIAFGTVPDAQRWLDEHDFRVYLADTDGADRYSSVDYSPRTALVMGNERFGIDRAWYREDAAKVYIPMLGAADSLNVSISAAVLLYEARSHLDGWRTSTPGNHSA